MFELISLLSSRTGIVLLSALMLSVTLVWGYQQKIGKLKVEHRLVQAERDYQARMADALERQREALEQAILDERNRRVVLEAKWKRITRLNKENADYEKTAPASIIHTLNSLSGRTTYR
jgi:hypothetical protein